MNGKRSENSERGSALVVAFIFILLVGLVCSSMYGYSSQQMHSSGRTRDFLKAKAIAEAGANEAYNKIKNNFSVITNEDLFPLTTFGGGTYDATLVVSGSNRAQLVCVGRCGSAEATVSADLLNQSQQVVAWNSEDQKIIAEVFTNYAVLAGTTIDWGGGGVISNGGLVKANSKLSMVGGGEFRGPAIKVYSSSEIYVQGSSEILGNGYAPLFTGKTGSITTVNIQAVPTVAVPLIDLTAFYQRAYSNSQVRSGTFLINSDYIPNGGVLWVNGDLKISNGRLKGCFIATGNISSSTGNSCTSSNGFPLFISRDGTIKVTSTPDMKGIIYARGGNIDWTGGGKIEGSLIASGYINKGGGSDLMINFAGVPPVIPDVPTTVTNLVDYVIISAWQQ